MKKTRSLRLEENDVPVEHPYPQSCLKIQETVQQEAD